MSIPDTALLVPLSELLGVTVTELLLCRRQEPDKALDPGTVEDVVKTAIQYPQGKAERAYRKKSRWFAAYLLCLLLGAAGMYANVRLGMSMELLPTPVILGAVFGAYFCFFVPTRLPELYDKYSLNLVSDGIFRMNVPGVRFHNGNWPHIVTVGRVWSGAIMAGMPLLSLALGLICPGLWQVAQLGIILALTLGGLFLPLYVVGKKYQ